VLEMALRRRSRATFTLDALWTKRVDGHNKYEGRAAEDIVRRLYVHDLGMFRRDFAGDLTLRERSFLSGRHLLWQGHLAYLRLRRRGSRPGPPPRRRAPRQRP
jgi:hypothetical protein